MAYLLGTDEAGYGPNLGPLVISASVWETPEGPPGDDLYERLQGCVAASPAGASRRADCVAIADSKALYQPGKGLALLERGVLAALAALGRRARSCAEAWQALAPDCDVHRRAIAWYAGFDRPLPLENDPAAIDSLGAALAAGLSDCGVRLVDLRSQAVFEEQFNQAVDRHGSKGEVLSRRTLELAASLIQDLPDAPIHVVCDKHGGRNSYGRLLGEAFPDWLIEVHGESTQRSVYRFGPPQRRIEVRFQARGESHLPTALASMASKYLRELSMLALNAFWQAEIPDLAPTAGYPQDARRFRLDIAAAQQRLGIEERVMWRCR